MWIVVFLVQCVSILSVPCLKCVGSGIPYSTWVGSGVPCSMCVYTVGTMLEVCR